NPLPAEQATLAELAARGTSFKYNYTFGDDWQHSVEIEAVSPGEDDGKYPRLLHAEGRCPPADIGPSGYDLFLRALADPTHTHHETMRDFDDPDFDPRHADIATLRANLASLAKYLGRRKVEPH